MDLAEKKQRLAEIGDQWELVENSRRIRRTWKFSNFKQALEFANMAGEIAEEMNHHPQLTVGWGFCVVEVWTHTKDDLTSKDFDLASGINSLPPAKVDS